MDSIETIRKQIEIYSIKKLIKLAKDLDVKVYKNMDKDELIRLILSRFYVLMH
jgi:hypothetical protein